MKSGKKTIVTVLVLILAVAFATVVALIFLSPEKPLPSGNSYKKPAKSEHPTGRIDQRETKARAKVRPVPKTPAEQTITAQSPVSTTSVPPVLSSQKPLRRGMQDDDVRQLQTRLIALGYSPGPINGYFGEQTYYAVVAFQKVNGLARDGVAGPKTLQAISNPVGVTARYGGSHIEVDKSHQVLLVVKDGHVARIISASTRKPGYTTPSGVSAVYYKPGYKYWSTKYGGWMIWSSFFKGGIAVHGFSSVPPYPASHGCVRIPIPDSKYVYDNMPIGSLVYVY